MFCVERASFDARSPGASFFYKQLPLRNAVRIANERRYRQFLRRAWHGEQLQAGLVRQAVALLRVHGPARPHQVFPRVLATARARHDVVEAAFLRLQQLVRVLAAIAVAFANRFRAELRALLRHPGKVHRQPDA